MKIWYFHENVNFDTLKKKSKLGKGWTPDPTFFGFEATKPKLIDGIKESRGDIAARGHIQMSKTISIGKSHEFPVKAPDLPSGAQKH